MSLQTALDRIAQIESWLSPPSATGAASANATGGTAAPTSTAGGTSSSSFASSLTQAMATSPSSAADATATLPASTTAASTSLPAIATAASASTLPASAYTPLSGAALTTALETTPTAASQPLSDAGQGNQAMVSIARSQIGQAEEPLGSNNSPAIAVYRSAAAGSVPGDPWCAIFASWASREAGTPLGDQGQGFTSVSQVWNWAQQNGRAVVNGPGVVPKPGDLICFGSEHVGIVEGVLPNGDIETIEGNYANRVSQNIRSPTQATGYVEMS